MTPAAVAVPPRAPGLRRVLSGTVALTALGVTCVMAALPRVADAKVGATRPLVTLLHDHVVQLKPNDRARRIESVSARRPLTGVRTVLPVLGRSTSRRGKAWIRVRLPGRPNSHTGWIAARQTRRTATPWRLVLKLPARLVTVYLDGRPVRRFRAVVGKPSTPTPSGHFFVEEPLAIAGQAGGPYALATSARSDVLQEFEGGPGQIAIHGTDYLAGALGTAASHGCIRLSTTAITWLAERIGSGVPLAIVP